MVKFECQNCNNIFERFCDNETDLREVICPECGSHWVELIKKLPDKIIFPRLPYSDPQFPIPHFGPFPYDKPSPWPKENGWIVTCSKINDYAVYSYHQTFSKID